METYAEVNCDASNLQLLTTSFTSFLLTLNISITMQCATSGSKMSIVYENIYVKNTKSTQIIIDCLLTYQA